MPLLANLTCCCLQASDRDKFDILHGVIKALGALPKHSKSVMEPMWEHAVNQITAQMKRLQVEGLVLQVLQPACSPFPILVAEAHPCLTCRQNLAICAVHGLHDRVEPLTYSWAIILASRTAGYMRAVPTGGGCLDGGHQTIGTGVTT